MFQGKINSIFNRRWSNDHRIQLCNSKDWTGWCKGKHKEDKRLYVIKASVSNVLSPPLNSAQSSLVFCVTDYFIRFHNLPIMYNISIFFKTMSVRSSTWSVRQTCGFPWLASFLGKLTTTIGSLFPRPQDFLVASDLIVYNCWVCCACMLNCFSCVWPLGSYGLLGSMVRGLLQAAIQEWVAMPSSTQSF